MVLDHAIRDSGFAVQAGAGYMWFDADDDRFSYDGPDVFAGVAFRGWANGSVYARIGYRQYDFEGPEPLFAVPRDEDEIRTVVGFQHDFAGGALRRWSLQGNWIYTNNDSNVLLYDYDRHQLSVGLGRTF